MAVGKVPVPVARKLANLTQKALADICGVSESTVANWEKFKTEPTVSQAQTIANACGLALDDIIFLPENTV
jgi:transcriptional regulator with XRE-family HTH domain